MSNFGENKRGVYMENINWDAVSAIGSWLGAGATFLAAMLALYPYFKKNKIVFHNK